MTPEAIANRVAAAFGRSPTSLWVRHRGKQAPARAVLVYLLVQYLPRPLFYPAKAGSVRKAADRDGNTKAVARLTRMHPSGVRYLLRRVEDMRDDPEFDAKVSALEAALDAERASR